MKAAVRFRLLFRMMSLTRRRRRCKGEHWCLERVPKPWYKYAPDALRAAFIADADDLAERPTKRKKLDTDESATPSDNTQPSLLLKWDDSDRCCIVRNLSVNAKSPNTSRYALFITQQSRAKECISYHLPESTPTPSADVSTNGAESESGSSVDHSPQLVAAIGAGTPAASPLRELTVDDWVVQSHCVHTKEEDIWLLGLDSMQFVDAGIRIDRMRTLPVTRWKFVSVS
ncbi:hypothetical protein BT96DRAFT_337848 [Gymnopus androsaceus JB14]|uniref:Uncharacterized protein n=1 Tax=Gymnopus androsaceus JB14 TaxID=1447944 RepID=A0A6A4I9L4_9AGAR|nr:hypothetical protein BT96DRAFT_337848 [Gymnopus androsaceus JB14]